MQTITDVRHRTGEVLQFNYLSGSTPGAVRTVYVVGYTGHNDAVQAYCFDRETIRNFSRSQIRNVTVVPTNKISTRLLPSNLDVIIAGYKADGKRVFHDEDRGELVVFHPPQFSHTTGRSTLLLRGPSGGVKLDVSHGPELTLYDKQGKPTRTIAQPSTLDIIDAVNGIG